MYIYFSYSKMWTKHVYLFHSYSKIWASNMWYFDPCRGCMDQFSEDFSSVNVVYSKLDNAGSYYWNYCLEAL